MFAARSCSTLECGDHGKQIMELPHRHCWPAHNVLIIDEFASVAGQYRSSLDRMFANGFD